MRRFLLAACAAAAMIFFAACDGNYSGAESGDADITIPVLGTGIADLIGDNPYAR